VGGAGSSKSHSVAQFIIRLFYTEPCRILVTRKTTPSLRISVLKLLKELLDEYQLEYHVNKTELTFSNDIGAEINLKGLDDPEKIKSAEFNYIWAEESTELSLYDYRQLDLRLRRKTKSQNRMFLSCNPISALHWIKTELEDKPDKDVGFNYSTWKDNPHLPQDYIDRLEGLKDQDTNYYNIYALGKWGILANLIYSGFKVVKTPTTSSEVTYGLDFGFNNPSCLVKLYWVDGKFISQELLYKSGLTNTMLIEEVKRLIPEADRQRYLYADSAEPDRIEEFYKAGFNIQKAEKSVKDGIDFVRQNSSGITADSVNGIKEKQTYKYKEDKNGNVLEEPVKFNDHFCDSERYGAYSYSKVVIPEVTML
tara:strand:- start:1464 stop:2561 length:1098 start_codon:yes stop_codon:yes gene_type:complete